jgi:hypothetical protein
LALLAVLARRRGLWLADDIAVRVHAARRVLVHGIALVAGRIHAAQGVVEHIAVAIEVLAVQRVLDQRIHAQKAAQRRVVGAAVHVDEAVIACSGQSLMFLAPDFVHGLTKMFGNMKLVEHNLGFSIGDMRLGGLDVRPKETEYQECVRITVDCA